MFWRGPQHIDLAEPAAGLITDIHNHVLPGLDDGSANLKESILMLEGLHALGYKKVIATPHVMAGHFPTSPQEIFSALEKSKNALKETGLDLELSAAAEYMADEGFAAELLRSSLLSFGEQMVLFECSYFQPYPGLGDYLFQLQVQEYKPILAHPERYPYWQRKREDLTRLYDMGILFQVNYASFLGAYGPVARKTALWLLEQDMIDLLGSDLHRSQDLPVLKDALRLPVVQELINRNRLLNPGL